MPSHRSPKESQQVGSISSGNQSIARLQTQRGQGVLKDTPIRGQAAPHMVNNQSAITVGDRVEILDCPAHWNWASPFTVEAIEGKMVKLELVGELVEIERLSGVVTGNYRIIASENYEEKEI
jgi:hypothetical protein